RAIYEEGEGVLSKPGVSLRSLARAVGRRRRVAVVLGTVMTILIVEGVFALTGASALQAIGITHGAGVPRAQMAPISQTNKTTGNITVGHSYKNDVSAPLTSMRPQPIGQPRAEHEVITNLHPASIHRDSPTALVQSKAA